MMISPNVASGSGGAGDSAGGGDSSEESAGTGDSGVKSKSMANRHGQGGSIVYASFEDGNTDREMVCKLCKTVVRFHTTSNLWSHLKRKHRSYHNEVKLASSRPTQESFNPRPFKRRRMDTDVKRKGYELYHCLVWKSYPFSDVEVRPGIVDPLVRMFMGETMAPPSRITMTKWLNEDVEEITSKIRYYFGGVDSIYLSGDSWSAKRSMFGLMAHFPTSTYGNVTLLLGVIPKDKHDATGIRDLVRAKLKEFGLCNRTEDELWVYPKVRGFTSDTTAVMPKFVGKLSGVQWIPCACHVLNLIAKKGVQSSLVLNELLKKCSGIVSVINGSSVKKKEFMAKLHELKPEIKHLTLKGMVETRFNTHLLMIRSMLPARLAFEALNYRVSSREWTLLEGLVPLLQPIESLSRRLEGAKYPTMSLVYPMMTVLIETINAHEPTERELKLVRGGMMKVVQSKWKQFYRPMPVEMKLTPVILDPQVRASRLYPKISTTARQQTDIRLCEASIRRSLPEPQSSSDQSRDDPFDLGLSMSVQESLSGDLLTTYLSECESDPPKVNARGHRESSDEWYRRHPKLDPLAKLYRTYSFCPAAACSVKRLWSKAKLLNIDVRTNTKDENFSSLLFLRYNEAVLKKLGIHSRFLDVFANDQAYTF
eukprot:TRINITY_DN277_c0_g1_i2.p1 TRINITY_DN277_c0_g1~~TRINITY_DN277_c0_g1_i2.p1  ORF type:complete len:651 (+),score=74.87 TRINITY_DN277_c0_g1_i2:23-1975(+)